MDDAPSRRTLPGPVRLHPHRGIGWGLYGTATALVGVVGTASAVGYLRSGRWLLAGLCILVSVPLTAFLATLTQALVRPALTVTPSGIAGSTPRGRSIAVSWEQVTIDADDDAAPSALRLDVGEECVPISAAGWVGFADVVRLVHGTPRASARLTPAGLRAVRRLLRLE